LTAFSQARISGDVLCTGDGREPSISDNGGQIVDCWPVYRSQHLPTVDDEAK